MKKNKKAESIIGVIIGIIVLSVVVAAITNVLIFSSRELNDFREVREINTLKSNLTNIIKNTDTSAIVENEVFYVYKNTSSKNYEVFTGSSNSDYKYINKYGESVDPDTYNDNVYARILWLEREDTSLDDQNQVIKVSIKKLIKK